MPIIKVHKSSDYTTICNVHLREKQMSLKAKGLLTTMLSLRDDWKYSVSGLCAILLENETAIETALKELKKFGYLIVTKKFPHETASGRIEYVYDIYEKPQKQEGENLPLENLPLENLPIEIQPVENPPQLNTNKLNNQGCKKVSNKRKESSSARTRAQGDDSSCPKDYPRESYQEIFDRHGYSFTLQSCLFEFIQFLILNKKTPTNAALEKMLVSIELTAKDIIGRSAALSDKRQNYIWRSVKQALEGKHFDLRPVKDYIPDNELSEAEWQQIAADDIAAGLFGKNTEKN